MGTGHYDRHLSDAIAHTDSYWPHLHRRRQRQQRLHLRLQLRPRLGDTNGYSDSHQLHLLLQPPATFAPTATATFTPTATATFTPTPTATLRLRLQLY